MLTFGGRDYEHTRPLIDGRVKLRGERIDYSAFTNTDLLFRSMLNEKRFDASEFSISTYIRLLSSGDQELTAIPVFPWRKFRHSYIFCNTDSKVNEPLDLVGKRVGILQWQQTAAVWMKGILQHEYDVPIEKINWIRFAEERHGKDRPIRRFEIQNAPELEPATANARADHALEEGKIDALLSATIPPSFGRSESVRRLFGDYLPIEEAYYKKTGIFPIMHTVVLRRRVCEKDAKLAEDLLAAFEEAKKMAYEEFIDRSDFSCYVWGRNAVERQSSILGDDPFACGVERNRKAIETLMKYQIEQETIERAPPLRSLFAV